MRTIFSAWVLILLFCGVVLARGVERVVTVRGVAQATKGGVMVQGVVIPEDALPKNYRIAALIGKTVRITGVVSHIVAEPLPLPPPAPQEQMREGPYDEMSIVRDVAIEKKPGNAHE